jgi:hypothetical protein
MEYFKNSDRREKYVTHSLVVCYIEVAVLAVKLGLAHPILCHFFSPSLMETSIHTEHTSELKWRSDQSDGRDTLRNEGGNDSSSSDGRGVRN